MNAPFTPPDLTGRIALVTGGGTGLGAAFARGLARRGAAVELWGRRSEPLEEVVESIRATGGRARWASVDVSDEGAVAAAAAERDESLHVLVNNAAVLGPVATLPEISPAAFAQVMRINVDGVFHVTRALLPSLVAGSVVINLSSGVGRKGRARWGAYAASKFAVEGLTQVWADELGPQGIRVHALNPGGTRTSMRAAAKPEEDPMTLPTPEDVVPSLLYLLAVETAGATGMSIDSRDFMNR